MESLKTINVKASFTQDIVVLGDQSKAKKCYVLLHGHALTGQFMADFLSSLQNEETLIIAPNAPFPYPVKSKSGFKEGYTWYFYDPVKEKYHTDYNTVSLPLKEFIKSTARDLPLTIIGYSQGGYLAPFLGSLISQTKKVICLGASTRLSLMPKSLNFELYSINGEHDLIINYEGAKENMTKLIERSVGGKFITIDDAHRLTPRYLHALREVL